MNRHKSRKTVAAVSATAILALGLPAAALANGDPGALPPVLQDFVSPLPPEHTEQLVDYGLTVQGDQPELPRFLPGTPPEQRAEAIAAIDRTLERVVASGEADAVLLDSVAVWESMTPEQKESVLTDTDAILAVWPTAVLATAAAVTAVVAVVDLTIRLYQETRADEPEEPECPDGDDEDDDDDGDGEGPDDEETIRGALGY